MLLSCGDDLHNWHHSWSNVRYDIYGPHIICSGSRICRVDWTKRALSSDLKSFHRYERALRSQPQLPLLLSPAFQLGAYALLISGNVLVLTSMWALGLTGTYLGDYFGILMDAPVTGFPFNVTGAPMYVGSTLSFLGSAILFGKPAGLLLTAEVWTIYSIALRFEE